MQTRAPSRMNLRWAPVLAALVLAVALYLFAAALTRVHLDQSGARSYNARAAGKTPWQWRFTKPEDLVAGRAFGAASLEMGHQSLVVRSQDATTVELGLPLSYRADLRRANNLHLDYSASTPPRLALRVTAAPGQTTCLARLPAHADHQWQLRTLHWQTPPGHACPAPQTASRLRLRVQQGAGQTFTLRSARLRPEHALPLAEPTDVPSHGEAARKLLLRLQTQAHGSSWPVLRLPAVVAPQHQLALRDAIHRQVPGAVVLGPDATVSPMHIPHGLHWIVAGLYALILLGQVFMQGRAKPGRRTHPLIEIALALFGLFWLIPGLQLGLHPMPADVLIAALGGAYAVRLVWQSAGNGSWLGHARDYPAPFALLLVLIVLVACFGHPPTLPSARQALVYLIWAALQQTLMLVVVLQRLQQTFARIAPALLGCALIFALLHTPNVRLMLLCLLAEMWWAWCYTRSRAVAPIALAHTVFALVIQASLSGGWLRSLEVSARYFISS